MDRTKTATTAKKAKTWPRILKELNKKQLANPPKDLRPWEPILGKYRPLGLLGSGTFGDVLKAEVKATAEMVAIKRFNLKCMVDEALQKILREIQIQRRLSQMKNNKFVAKVLDIVVSENLGEDEGYLFLVMEYLPTDLFKLLELSNYFQFDESSVKKVLYQLLCCLQFLHSANIMHRDIKPSNILVDENLNIKICDFGLARELLKVPHPEDSLTSLSRESRASILKDTRHDRRTRKRALSRHVVTRWYRPPEVILMERYYASPVDIWSTGCVLFEMLYSQTAYAPFNEDKQRILFKGDSCYPLSPKPKEKAHSKSKDVSSQDMLKMILGTMGDQGSSSLSFITERQNKEYARSMMAKVPKLKFKKELDANSEDLIEVLESMLEFNPYFRPSASELMKHSIFDSVRELAWEQEADEKIYLKIDEPGLYDYAQSSFATSALRRSVFEQISKEVELIHH